MFSSLRLLMLLVSAALVSCNVNVGEKPAPVAAHELGNTKCLSDVSPTFGSFFRGTAQDEELNKLWTCVDTAIETFNRYVRGADKGVYSPQEIATFLENNFLKPGSDISSGFQLEIMKVKTLLVGGETSKISRQELDRLRDLLKILQAISLDLNPHMKTFALTWKNKKTPEENDYLKQASAVFLASLTKIAKVIDSNHKTYRFDDFLSLAREMSDFFEENWTFPEALERYLPVIKEVKKALTGGSGDVIAVNEWGQVATLGGRGYSLYLHWFYLVRDNPTEAETSVTYATRILDEVFSIFADIIVFKKDPTVTQTEVSDLLESLQGIWPEFKVSSALVSHMMKFKVTVLGGKESVITAEEFSLGRTKIAAIRPAIEEIRGILPFAVGKWNLSQLSFENARQLYSVYKGDLLKTTATIAGQLEGTYDLNNIEPFIEELYKLYPEQKSGFTKEIKAHLKFAITLKKMFFGGDTQIDKSQWGPLVATVTEAYAVALHYTYFNGHDKWKLPAQDRSWIDLLEGGLSLAQKMLASKKSQVLDKSEIKTIAKYLLGQGLLPRLSDRSLDRTIDILVNNALLTPERRLNGARPQAINKSSLEVLRSELGMFLQTQAFLSQWRESWGNLVARGGGVVYSHFEQEINKKSNPAELRLALREMTYSVSTVMPLTLDSQNRVTITNRKELFYSLDSLRALNVYRGLSRLLIRSFGASSARIQNYQGVTLKETENAFARVFPIVVELGLIEGDNYTFASSRFREANMFMPHSDGNNLVSYVEMVDLMAMIWSGLNIDSLIRKDIERGCFGGRKIGNQTQIPMRCLVNVYYPNMQRHMVSSPDYVRFTNSITTDMWALYIHNIYKAAGYVPNSKQLARTGDISLAPHVMQYIELLYARYDKNKNDRIDTQEALVAYHAFKSIITQLAASELKSGSLKESDLPSLFTYIIKHGKPPETMPEKISFAMNWRGKPKQWNLQATRLELAKILGYIADQTSRMASKDFVDN